MGVKKRRSDERDRRNRQGFYLGENTFASKTKGKKKKGKTQNGEPLAMPSSVGGKIQEEAYREMKEIFQWGAHSSVGKWDALNG